MRAGYVRFHIGIPAELVAMMKAKAWISVASLWSEDGGFRQEAGGICVVVPHRIIDILECRDRPSCRNKPRRCRVAEVCFSPKSGRPLGMKRECCRALPAVQQGNPAAFGSRQKENPLMSVVAKASGANTRAGNSFFNHNAGSVLSSIGTESADQELAGKITLINRLACSLAAVPAITSASRPQRIGN